MLIESIFPFSSHNLLLGKVFKMQIHANIYCHMMTQSDSLHTKHYSSPHKFSFTFPWPHDIFHQDKCYQKK